MNEQTLVQSLGFIIVAAAAFALIARPARVPTIVAYLLAGLLLGPITGIVAMTGAMHVIAEVGIALLLFLVGLELSFDKIRDVGKVALAAGIGQVLFTAAGGFVVAYLLGFEVMESVFIATALTFSSTVVVVKLLDQKKELNSLYGRIAVGIFLVQDMVVILALTFLAGLGAGEMTDAEQVGGGILMAFLGMAGLLAVALLASRWILPAPFRWAAQSAETLFIWSLCWCFLFVLAAETLGLSLEIGAFLAGISLAQLPYNHDLRRRVHPLMSFFIAVFFVTLGLQMELGEAFTQLGPAIVLSLFVLIGNPLIFMVIISRMGYDERTSFLTSVTVAQISEFSFIFAAMGLAAGLIDSAILSLIALVGLVTFAVSAYMILYNHQLYALVRRAGLLRPFRATAAPPSRDEDDGRLRDHVIVVGMNSLGRQIVRRLVEAGRPVIAIDTDPGKLADLPCPTILGNVEYLSVLDEAGLDDAKLLVSTLQIEDTNNLLAYRAVEAGVPSSIHAFDRSVIDELREIGVSHLMISKNDGIKRLAAEVWSSGWLEPANESEEEL